MVVSWKETFVSVRYKVCVAVVRFVVQLDGEQDAMSRACGAGIIGEGNVQSKQEASQVASLVPVGVSLT